MDFKYRVISQLNLENNLVLLASDHFKEPSAAIENAVNLITDATIAALNFQCTQNKKTEEIFKIGKECAILNFSTLFGTDLRIIEKGRGINSEIFGVDLVYKVDEIARKTQVRNKTVNSLMASITPAILSILHWISEEGNYTHLELCNYLKIAMGHQGDTPSKGLIN